MGHAFDIFEKLMQHPPLDTTITRASLAGARALDEYIDDLVERGQSEERRQKVRECLKHVTRHDEPQQGEGPDTEVAWFEPALA